MVHQQQMYERSYQNADSEYGFPDRKISNDYSLYGQHILNLGCGTGADTWYLAKENIVIGLDYAASGLLVGKSHGILGTLSDLSADPALPFPNQVFDIIVCKDILEHIIDPLSMLQELSRVLKDSGYMVISVPNHFYLPLRMRILLGKGLIWKTIGSNHSHHYDEWNYMHIRFFTYKGFRRLLKAALLDPEKWFWDFGGLAHYENPDMWLEPQIWKNARGFSLSKRGRFGLRVVKPLWNAINFIFPRSLRSALVSIAPGALCAGFYLIARKQKEASQPSTDN
jgi:SAM-dependent methyltransferase